MTGHKEIYSEISTFRESNYNGVSDKYRSKHNMKYDSKNNSISIDSDINGNKTHKYIKLKKQDIQQLFKPNNNTNIKNLEDTLKQLITKKNNKNTQLKTKRTQRKKQKRTKGGTIKTNNKHKKKTRTTKHQKKNKRKTHKKKR
tara:strand:+ start:804 stop:1232 length:429 start_codon:yes stop_codon:yes gene_type:complete